jgi:hypothetical protein
MSVITTELAGWDSFYLIVGSAAGALIGLQFVVMTLIAQKPIPEGGARAGAVFGTPTIVHFGAVLLLSALLRAPWQTIGILAALLSAIGFGGVVYICIVAIRLRRQEAYLPNLADWLFFVVLPLAAYAFLTSYSFIEPTYLHEAFFGVGAAALLLLFVAIHNAWDSISYFVFAYNIEQE